MSGIAKKMDYILNNICLLQPEIIKYYQSGLSCQSIDELTKDFPFNLSQEVYELYQWRNGLAQRHFQNNWCKHEFLFPEQLKSDVTCSFCSLQDAMYLYRIMRDAGDNDDEYWHQKWFPIASFECKRMLYVVGDADPSPVYLWDVDYFNQNPVRVYKNLTSMVSVVAECCEFGLYQLTPYEYGEEGEMRIRIDKARLNLEKEIYQKYNS
jgi:SMI1 / KNR4 family (SUKH-1)